MPPPAWPGLVTVTGIVPGVAMADAGTMTTNWFVVTNWVVCRAPLKLTTASWLKLLPLTVKVEPWVTRIRDVRHKLGNGWNCSGLRRRGHGLAVSAS